MALSTIRSRLLAAAIAGVSLHASAAAQDDRRRSSQRDAGQVLAQLDPVTVEVSRSVHVLRCGRDACALGTVVHEDGWLISKASELELPLSCELANGRRVVAEIRAVDQAFDVALIKVRGVDGLHPVEWGERTLPVGSMVIASGPRAQAVGMGVVGGKPRALEAGRPMLGVQLDEEAARIVRIVRGTTAERIGLEAEDVVLEVNGTEIESRAQLVGALSRLRVGDEISLVVAREGEALEFEATLGSWEEEGLMDGRKSRVRSGFPRVFRHDCVLQPSQCGGPLVDLDGRAVGLNIARAGRTASYAIPAEKVAELTGQLMKKAAQELTSHE